MIEEVAQVVEIKGDRLVLEVQRQSACGSCSASSGCGTSLLSKVVGRKFSRFQAGNSINASPGDTVVVAIAEEALVKASLVMYIVPVLGIILFALLADLYLSQALMQRDLYVALAAFVGLIAGTLAARWYFDVHGSIRRFTPVVLRKIIR